MVYRQLIKAVKCGPHVMSIQSFKCICTAHIDSRHIAHMHLQAILPLSTCKYIGMSQTISNNVHSDREPMHELHKQILCVGFACIGLKLLGHIWSTPGGPFTWHCKSMRKLTGKPHRQSRKLCRCQMLRSCKQLSSNTRKVEW
jgi:hypothetical protein